MCILTHYVVWAGMNTQSKLLFALHYMIYMLVTGQTTLNKTNKFTESTY